MTSVDDLIAFYAARLDEEERLADAATHAGLGIDIGPGGKAVSDDPDVQDHFATWNPSRVRREVEAKRAIVAEFQKVDKPEDPWHADADATFWSVIKHMASAYSDHPDYRPEWAPEPG